MWQISSNKYKINLWYKSDKFESVCCTADFKSNIGSRLKDADFATNFHALNLRLQSKHGVNLSVKSRLVPNTLIGSSGYWEYYAKNAARNRPQITYLPDLAACATYGFSTNSKDWCEIDREDKSRIEERI